MHGGDCGSSICRKGGGPTHALTWLAGTASCGGDGLGDGLLSPAPGPLPLPPGAAPLAVPLTAAACPGGAFLMICLAFGENSAPVGGAAVAACSSSGSRTASTPTATPRLTVPAVRPGRRSARPGCGEVMRRWLRDRGATCHVLFLRFRPLALVQFIRYDVGSGGRLLALGARQGQRVHDARGQAVPDLIGASEHREGDASGPAVPGCVRVRPGRS